MTEEKKTFKEEVKEESVMKKLFVGDVISRDSSLFSKLVIGMASGGIAIFCGIRMIQDLYGPQDHVGTYLIVSLIAAVVHFLCARRYLVYAPALQKLFSVLVVLSVLLPAIIVWFISLFLDIHVSTDTVCPYCGSRISRFDTTCPYCGRNV